MTPEGTTAIKEIENKLKSDQELVEKDLEKMDEVLLSWKEITSTIVIPVIMKEENIVPISHRILSGYGPEVLAYCHWDQSKKLMKTDNQIMCFLEYCYNFISNYSVRTFYKGSATKDRRFSFYDVLEVKRISWKYKKHSNQNISHLAIDILTDIKGILEEVKSMHLINFIPEEIENPIISIYSSLTHNRIFKAFDIGKKILGLDTTFRLPPLNSYEGKYITKAVFPIDLFNKLKESGFTFPENIGYKKSKNGSIIGVNISHLMYIEIYMYIAYLGNKNLFYILAGEIPSITLDTEIKE